MRLVGRLSFLSLFIFCATLEAGKQCVKDPWSIPGQFGITCFVPSCETPGADCSPPEIEPWLGFDVVAAGHGKLGKCDDPALNGISCYPIKTLLKIKLAAADVSGIKALGVIVKTIVANTVTFTTLWSNNPADDGEAPAADAAADRSTAKQFALPGDDAATVVEEPPKPKDSDNSREMFKWVKTQVPPGYRYEIWATDLCAIDTQNNQTCIPYRAPTRALAEPIK